MGCASASNQQLKSEQLAHFFDLCKLHGFSESQVVKLTQYEYHYIRGLREWRQVQSKSVFSDKSPVLLSPCLPDQFPKLIREVGKYQCQYPQHFKGFPKNIAMLLSIGDQFPAFQCRLLGSEQEQTFELQNQCPTIFVHWKLEEQKTIVKNLYISKSTTNRFTETTSNTARYLETAYMRAKIKFRDHFQIVGLCYDKLELQKDYEKFIQPGETHIWITEEDQSYGIFRFAEDLQQQVRSLEHSIFIVQQGIFMGCMQENLSDPQFVDNVYDRTQQIISEATVLEQRIHLFRTKVRHEIRRDDYHKVKNIIMEKLPERTAEINIGDTFKLCVHKYTYFYNYTKVGATYCQPTLWLAGSPKYKQNADALLKWLKDQTPIAHMQTDFKCRETFPKEKFFQKLAENIKEAGLTDLRFILEKSLTIYYDTRYKCFIMDRQIEQVHNAPLTIGAVFSRKPLLQKVGQDVLQHADVYQHSELRLYKSFFNNPYGISSCFHVGNIYSPIPNVYCVVHNDQSQIHGNAQFQSTLNAPKVQPYSKGIFDSKLVQSVNQSMNQNFPEIEQIPNNLSEIELSGAWEASQLAVDMNYDQIDCIQQKGTEVLLIYQIDYKESAEGLAQMLDYIKSNGWTKEQIRVIALSVNKMDDDFERSISKYNLDRYMSSGTLEPWFHIESNYLNVNFNKMLSDLYGLNQKEPVLIIDQLKRLLFRGKADKRFAQFLMKIVRGESSKTIHATDRPLKHRIDLAQFSKEWKNLKSYGYDAMKYSPVIREVQQYLECAPLKEFEFWKVRATSFQLWSHDGKLLHKFYEKPQIIHKLEKSETSVKFYHITEEIILKLGKQRVDIVDLTKQTQDNNKGHLLGEDLVTV